MSKTKFLNKTRYFLSRWELGILLY
jgi:hypothetical protein